MASSPVSKASPLRRSKRRRSSLADNSPAPPKNSHECIDTPPRAPKEIKEEKENVEQVGTEDSNTQDCSGSPERKVARVMREGMKEGNNPQLITFNPALFESMASWGYRDLQQLCIKLKLVATGSREDIIERLNEWHRDDSKLGVRTDSESEERRHAQNFALLGVRVDELSGHNARLLSPLKTRNPAYHADAILKVDGVPTKKKRGNILFSPYNGVKLIPSRNDAAVA